MDTPTPKLILTGNVKCSKGRWSGRVYVFNHKVFEIQRFLNGQGVADYHLWHYEDNSDIGQSIPVDGNTLFGIGWRWKTVERTVENFLIAQGY